MGLEPIRPFGHNILSVARMPIPTLPHVYWKSSLFIIDASLPLFQEAAAGSVDFFVNSIARSLASLIVIFSFYHDFRRRQVKFRNYG
jgi:hypothetical protein